MTFKSCKKDSYVLMGDFYHFIYMVYMSNFCSQAFYFMNEIMWIFNDPRRQVSIVHSYPFSPFIWKPVCIDLWDKLFKSLFQQNMNEIYSLQKTDFLSLILPLSSFILTNKHFLLSQHVLINERVFLFCCLIKSMENFTLQQDTAEISTSDNIIAD